MRQTKKDLEARIRELEARVTELQEDNDFYREEYYSEDLVQDMIRDAIRDHERDRLQDLQRYEPETHRRRFQLIHGGAA